MIDLGGFISTLVIGGLAGWVASMIMKTDASMGVFANIIVGIIGAFVGNLIFRALGWLGTTDSFSFQSFLVALLGAVVLLFLLKLLWPGHRNNVA